MDKSLDVNHIEDTQVISVKEEGFSTEYDAKLHASLRRKIDRRLLPLFCWLYLLNYLDRSNIGNAKILNQETNDSFLQSTGMNASDFSITVTLFSISYFLFEIPSNWVLKRYVRPSIWLAALMGGWGILTLGFAFVKSYVPVVVVRFFIGVFEAGFFPGMIYVVTFWYREEERAMRIAVISASGSLAGAFGGSIAYGVSHMNGKAGLKGWEWLFIIEGVLTILCIALVVMYSPDYPSTAKWLTTEEREVAQQRVDEQNAGFTREPATPAEIKETFGLRMFTNVVVYQGLVYFCPSIVAGLGYNSIIAQLMTIPPWAVSYVVALVLARIADKYNCRGYCTAVAAFVSGIAFLASYLLPAHAYGARYACLMVAFCGVFPSCNPLIAWVSCNSPSPRTVGYALAANNSMSGLASIVGVWMWRSSQAKQGYPTGNLVSCICSFITGALALVLRWQYGCMNRKNAPDSNARVWAY
ncbi:hypothetical protein AAFC00_006510 [Neodothiora populina]|uniref:Major facilitator superfamily (MFS) profile domain-containing protein n=1 Tax=Neodothiora populina TaxID=2781224 RepID=A0ABR3PAK0_9PEZI